MTHPRKISTNNMSSLNTNQSPQQLKPQRGKEYFKKRDIWVKVPTIPSLPSWVQCWWWLGTKENGEHTAHGKCRDFLKNERVLFTTQTFPTPCSRTRFRGQKPGSKPCNSTSGGILNLSPFPLEMRHAWNSLSRAGVHVKREVGCNTWLPLPRSEGRSTMPGFLRLRVNYWSKSRNLWWCWTQKRDLWVELRAALASCSLSVPALSLFWEFRQPKFPALCVSRF